ncbi:hypothetical protein BDV93DRAFT_607104 [Ceratobasidium sp. AG-I]|nr:hypothetical protein BDV93DRAFT_607104 [Ceratobasidium sp. AG-I]
MKDTLGGIPLLPFLDAYPEPAFILCLNISPQQILRLIYGNSALHSLVLGPGNPSVLNESELLNAFTNNDDLRWLHDPTYAAGGADFKVGYTRIVKFRPASVPPAHMLDKLHLTATPITLPITVSGVGSSSRSFVFTASPSQTSTEIFRATSSVNLRPRPQTGLGSLPNTPLGSLTPTKRAVGSSSLLSWSPSSSFATSHNAVPSQMINTFAWEKTPLGPREQWPTSLTMIVQYIMAKQEPTAIHWGWPDLIMIYNDSYAKLIGTKHPSIYAQKAATAWGDHWDKLSPVAELCRQGQSTSKSNDSLFFETFIEQGLPLESYYDWHWNPIWKEDGTVGGVLSGYCETTHEIITRRRLGCVADLIAELSEAKTQDSAIKVLMDVLSRFSIDLPFVALYLCHSDDKRPRPYLKYYDANSPKKAMSTMMLMKATLSLANAVGIPKHHPAAPHTLEYTLNPDTLLEHREGLGDSPEILDEDAATKRSEAGEQQSLQTGSPSSSYHAKSSNELPSWPFLEVYASGSPKIIDTLPSELAEGLDGGPFGDQPRSAVLVPVPLDFPGKHEGPHLPHAILVAGLNTRRPYDPDYQKWLQTVTATFSNRLLTILQLEVDEELIRERERLDKAKSRFFIAASHELRTPLALIQAPLEQVIESQDLVPDIKSKVGLATRNVDRLHRLVDAILDIGMLEAGRLMGRFRPVHLGQLTADLTALFQTTAERKKLELKFEAPDNENNAPQTYVDIQLWEKIFCNLLSNAFKYTQKGKITVSVSYDSTYAYVRVADTGIGIPKSKQETVFEQFERLNELAVEGFGIGLSLAKARLCLPRPNSLNMTKRLFQELTELHGGQLTLSSRAESELEGDTGSAFTVTIPLGANHLSSKMIVNSSETPQSRIDLGGMNRQQVEYWTQIEEPPILLHSGGINENSSKSSHFLFEQTDTILIVDDSLDMRRYLRSVFEPYLTVLEAGNGLQALEIAMSHEVNLILTDVLMPKISGKEFLSKLRREQKTGLVPVIFLTAAAEDIALLDGRIDGVVDCILKPFHVQDLLARAHLQLQLGKRRINLERSFAERTHELQTLVDFCPVGIFRTNSSGGMEYMNPKWHQITGYSTDKDKDGWSDHIHPDSRQEAMGAWHRCFFDKKSSSIRLQWVGNSWTQLDITPLITPDGQFLGAFGTITDITDLLRLEEARLSLAQERASSEALRAEDAESRRQVESERRNAQELLIDVASHELRQPISAILQNAEMVQANLKVLKDALATCFVNHAGYTPTESTMKELESDLLSLDTITQCGVSQARIANDILSLSGLQLEAVSIASVPFNIKCEVDEILLGFNNELASKCISLETTFGPGVGALGHSVILTDRNRLTQIITNLMSNAIRFTEMGGEVRMIRVSLDIAREHPSDESCGLPLAPMCPLPWSDSSEEPIYFCMSFQDSGPGLRKEDLNLLFQRFRQGSNAHPIFGGFGLDLFVCRQLCELMGGKIDSYNTPDSGAALHFFIRAIKLPPTSKPEFAPEPTNVRKLRRISRRLSDNISTSQSIHVLITEDNKINQVYNTRQMTRVGFTTVLASNGAEAVNAVIEAESSKHQATDVKSRFDVILMDLQMPVMDGFAATKEIRRLEAVGPLSTRHFIIAVTGNARSEQVQSAWDSGVDKVMIKPYNLDELVAAMLAGPENAAGRFN